MLNPYSSQTNGELAFPWTNEDLAKPIPPFLLPCKIPTKALLIANLRQILLLRVNYYP